MMASMKSNDPEVERIVVMDSSVAEDEVAAKAVTEEEVPSGVRAIEDVDVVVPEVDGETEETDLIAAAAVLAVLRSRSS